LSAGATISSQGHAKRSRRRPHRPRQ
jgi:hypothetical protein